MTMSNKSHSLQDIFLNSIRKNKTPVIVYLTNGTRLKGIVKGFDNFVIILQQGKQQLIYKHAISTIIPEKDTDIKLGDSQE